MGLRYGQTSRPTAVRIPGRPAPDSKNKLMLIRLLSICLLGILLTACTGTRDTRVDPDAADSVTGTGLQSMDIRTMASRMSADLVADVVGAVPREVAVGPAIRLFQRWGWDLLGERMAQRVRYHPGHKRALATLARAVDPPRLVDWLAALAEAQAVSEHPLNARLAVEQALLGYVDAMQGAAAHR